MHIFENYLEPLTQWLHMHPDAALFITFLVAFTESLAIIGSIIPGSITMTAIGILAGSGVFRIDLTMLFASLGAIAGDGASYLLGYYFRERLVLIWPFNHYPNLLSYGQIYFEKHGGKSVLIGRFVGPLRSIIPVIAGMLMMDRLRFFIANVVSGIAWAFLYITPGVLIGAASHELSPEKAAEFVLFILFGLIFIWLISITIKSLFLHFRNWFDTKLNNTWSGFLKTPYLGKICQVITPYMEKKHTYTALVCVFFFTSLVIFMGLTFVHYKGNTLFLLNQPIHLCIQSMRTHAFDVFFSVAHQFMTFIPVGCLFFFMVFTYLIKRETGASILLVGVMLFSIICVYFYQYKLHAAIEIKPDGILETINDSFYLFRKVALSTLVYLIVFYNNYGINLSFSRKCFSFLLIAGLVSASCSFVYLGDLWFTDLLAALFMGFNLSLIYLIIARKSKNLLRMGAPLFSTVGCIFFILSTIMANFMHADQTLKNHQIYFSQHVLSHTIWWGQEEAVLPVYSNNRFGKISSVFNVQYVGSMKNLRMLLEKHGWKVQKGSILYFMMKNNADRTHFENPLSKSLYLHQKPTLTLVYYPQNSATFVRLQLWRSNYYLYSFDQPIWLGHVQFLNRSLNKALYAQDPALFMLKKSIPSLKTKLVPLSASGPNANSLIKANYLLLIADGFI